MLFDGHHWLPRKEGEIYRLEKDAMRARQHHAELALPGLDATDREQDPDAAEEEKFKIQDLRWAKKGESKTRLEHMAALAEKEKVIAVAQDQWGRSVWDSDAHLLGVRNGVVDLRTGELRAGLPEDNITMVSPVDYKPATDTTKWRQFILDISDGVQELADYIQKVI